MKKDIRPVRLRLQLSDDYLSDYEKRMLKRYGESIDGESIVRDILIPSDMPLHNLHYAIQRLFGWQNSHLRRFYLPDEIYQDLTGGMVKGWSDLVGLVFQPPSEMDHDLFWDDDYESGSFGVWLRKKYTGPYRYGGIIEKPEIARKDIEDFLAYFNMIEVRESFADYLARDKGDEDEMKILKKAPIISLTLDEMNASIMLESGTDNLLERLWVDDVIGAQSEEIDSNALFPLTKELMYNYDFGDNWTLKITKYKDCHDLLEENHIGHDELEEAQRVVLDKHKPVCIHKSGISVLDDVGGLSGFANFLGVIYEGDDKEEASGSRAWARSLGWRAIKTSNKAML